MRRNQGIKGPRDQGSGPRILDSSIPRILPLGVSCGDPAGVGPEIILKALEKLPRRRPRIIGPRAVFEREQKRLGTKVDLDLVDDSVETPGRYAYGIPQAVCGSTAFLALEMGVYRLLHGHISALVTAPVSKEALRLAGFRWPGQTEFLAERLHANHYAMLAWTPRFKAVMVTIHLPLAYTTRHITPDTVADKTRLLDEFLRREGRKRPRIGVLAFNPHAYEFSRGEESWIAQGVAIARKAGIDAHGPLCADGTLANLHRSAGLSFGLRTSSLPFDGYVAMYHDQAMIPAKLLAGGKGVNVTLGLGHIRTSPLHGVAFDIAGKGIASAESMLAAIRLAQRLVRSSV